MAHSPFLLLIALSVLTASAAAQLPVPDECYYMRHKDECFRYFVSEGRRNLTTCCDSFKAALRALGDRQTICDCFEPTFKMARNAAPRIINILSVKCGTGSLCEDPDR